MTVFYRQGLSVAFRAGLGSKLHELFEIYAISLFRAVIIDFCGKIVIFASWDCQKCFGKFNVSNNRHVSGNIICDIHVK